LLNENFWVLDFQELRPVAGDLSWTGKTGRGRFVSDLKRLRMLDYILLHIGSPSCSDDNM
jgi:hypothetical protein